MKVDLSGQLVNSTPKYGTLEDIAKQVVESELKSKILGKTECFFKPASVQNLDFDLKVRTPFEKSIKLNIFEFHENSIVTKGFTVDEGFKLKTVSFDSKHSKHKINVTDSMVTPEIAILYLEKDPRKYKDFKRFKLNMSKDIVFGNGLLDQITVLDPTRVMSLIPSQIEKTK